MSEQFSNCCNAADLSATSLHNPFKILNYTFNSDGSTTNLQKVELISNISFFFVWSLPTTSILRLNDSAYKKDRSAVPVIMILIGQRAVFSSIWLKLHKWISNPENCPKDLVQSTQQKSSLAADEGCTGQKNKFHGSVDGLWLLCQTFSEFGKKCCD